MEFTVEDGRRTTAVVLPPNDFDKFCYKLESFEVLDLAPGTHTKVVNGIRAARVLRMLPRDAKSEHFFARWDIKTDFLSVIVQGAGDRLMPKALPV